MSILTKLWRDNELTLALALTSTYPSVHNSLTPLLVSDLARTRGDH